MGFQHLRMMCETLCQALEHSVTSNNETNSHVKKILYKALRAAVIQNDEMFVLISDRNHFLKNVIYEPLTQLGHELATLHVMPPHDTLKHARLLMELALIVVTKTGYLRNQYVFTVSVADNVEIVKVVNAFCNNIQQE